MSAANRLIGAGALIMALCCALLPLLGAAVGGGLLASGGIAAIAGVLVLVGVVSAVMRRRRGRSAC